MRARHTLRSAALLLALALQGATAWSAASPPRVVIWAEGPRHDAAAAEARAALGSGFTLTDEQPLLDALSREAHVRLGPVLANPTTRAHLLARLRRAARAVGVDAVVVVATPARGRSVTVLALDAATERSSLRRSAPESIGDVVRGELADIHAARGAEDGEDAQAAPSLAPPDATGGGAGGPATGALPSAHPEEVPVAVADVGPRVASPRITHSPDRELAELAAGVEVGARHLRYSDGLTPGLRAYDLGVAPLATVEGALYPLSGSRLLEDVGLIGGYAGAFALHSSAADVGTAETTWRRYHVGARMRVRTGDTSASPLLGISASYGAETFSVVAPSLVGLPPSVDYRFVRAAADVRVPLGRASIFADAAWLATLSGGEVPSQFPHSSVGGVEAELGGAVAVVSGLEVRLTASYRRFFYAMNPVPGDAFVAGGALDQFEGLNGSVAYVY